MRAHLPLALAAAYLILAAIHVGKGNDTIAAALICTANVWIAASMILGRLR